MNADAWQQLGGVAVLVVIGAFNTWHSRKANKQTEKTGNGFAKHVTDSLTRIEGKTDATHDLMVEHLADHAGSDLTNRRGA